MHSRNCSASPFRFSSPNSSTFLTPSFAFSKPIIHFN